MKFGRPVTLDKRAGEVLTLKKQGKGLRAIARQLGMASPSVHAILNRKQGKR